MDQFFSTTTTIDAFLPPHWFRLVSYGLLALVIYLCVNYHKKTWLKRFFFVFQVIQLIGLYGFYWIQGLPLSVSLPLYHCRIAMFVLLLKKEYSFKKYFALIGIFGCLSAIFFPIMDKYAWPHVTLVSFYWGHLALLGNSLIYLLEHQQQLKVQTILTITVAMNSGIALANQLTGGSYGFLNETPMIAHWPFLARFFVISVVLVLVVTFFQWFIAQIQQAVVSRKEKSVFGN